MRGDFTRVVVRPVYLDRSSSVTPALWLRSGQAPVGIQEGQDRERRQSPLRPSLSHIVSLRTE